MLRRHARQVKLTASLAGRGTARPPAPWDGLDVPELLATLPQGDRAVLLLRIAHDLTFGDVAAVLGISEEAAKKRAQRGLRRLRQDSRVRRWCSDGRGAASMAAAAERQAPGDLRAEAVPGRAR